MPQRIQQQGVQRILWINRGETVRHQQKQGLGRFRQALSSSAAGLDKGQAENAVQHSHRVICVTVRVTGTQAAINHSSSP